MNPAKLVRLWPLLLVWLALPMSLRAEAAYPTPSAMEAGKPSPPPRAEPPVGTSAGAALVAIVTLDLLFLAGLRLVIRQLGKDPKWSLGSALGEGASADAAAMPLVQGPAKYPPLPGNAPTLRMGSAVAFTYQESSLSRLIAFVGMGAILLLFFGFGNWLLWHCIHVGRVPSATGEIAVFLAGGGALFVPYLANQTRAGMEGLLGRSRR